MTPKLDGADGLEKAASKVIRTWRDWEFSGAQILSARDHQEAHRMAVNDMEVALAAIPKPDADPRLKRCSALLCQCSHRHDQHHPIRSVNYSAGHCKNCTCQGFVILPAAIPMDQKCTCRTILDDAGPYGNGHAKGCEWGKANAAHAAQKEGL